MKNFLLHKIMLFNYFILVSPALMANSALSKFKTNLSSESTSTASNITYWVGFAIPAIAIVVSVYYLIMSVGDFRDNKAGKALLTIILAIVISIIAFIIGNYLMDLSKEIK